MSNTASSTFNTIERPRSAASSAPRSLVAQLQIVFCVIALVLGLLQSWTERHAVDSDGISYLDMGDAYLRGDWAMAINAYWSPFYSWLLGLAMLIIKPSAYWEFTVVHAVNLIIYVGALLSFTLFLSELQRYQRQQAQAAAERGAAAWISLPEWALMVVGYTLFIWSSLEWISLAKVTPDMCVAACVYLASAILLQIRRGAAGRAEFVGLGVVLGVSYLAKAVMFPLAFVFLGVSMLAVGNLRRGAGRALLSAAIFLSIAGPLLVALSVSKNRVTFGDSGKLNYAWYMAGVTYRHWQGEPGGSSSSGVPQHPTRKILDNPAIYEFAEPIKGTYPLWYDPTYWYEGVRAPFSLSRHIKATVWRPYLFSSIFYTLQGSLVAGLFILLYMSGRRWWLVARDATAYWFLLVPGIAGLGLYMQVHVEQRLIAPFLVLLFIGGFSSVRLPDLPETSRLVSCVTIIILAMLMVSIGPSTARAAYSTAHEAITGQASEPHVDWQVADGLQQMGLRPGDKVASLEYSNAGNAQWARLARVRIVAEIFYDAFNTEENAFWEADAGGRRRAIETFARTGAKVIVDDSVPSWAVATEGWQRIGDTDYHAYFLPAVVNQ